MNLLSGNWKQTVLEYVKLMRSNFDIWHNYGRYHPETNFEWQIGRSNHKQTKELPGQERSNAEAQTPNINLLTGHNQSYSCSHISPSHPTRTCTPPPLPLHTSLPHWRLDAKTTFWSNPQTSSLPLHCQLVEWNASGYHRGVQMATFSAHASFRDGLQGWCLWDSGCLCKTSWCVRTKFRKMPPCNVSVTTVPFYPKKCNEWWGATRRSTCFELSSSAKSALAIVSRTWKATSTFRECVHVPVNNISLTQVYGLIVKIALIHWLIHWLVDGIIHWFIRKMENHKDFAFAVDFATFTFAPTYLLLLLPLRT